MRSWWLVVGLLIGLTTSRAEADAAASKNQALLMLRILAYDHNLASRVDNKKVTIFIVHRAPTEDAATEFAGVLRQISASTKIAGNSISVVTLPYNEKTFDADIAKTKGAALWIAPGLGDAVGSVTGVTSRRRLLSFTSTPDYVAAGVAIGVTLQNGKPAISVNLPASRREGADLDAALLKVAKIVKK